MIKKNCYIEFLKNVELTVLGPLMFKLYNADLLSCVRHTNLHMYADDCQLHIFYEPSSTHLAID